MNAAPVDKAMFRRMEIIRLAKSYFEEMMKFVHEFDEGVFVPADEKVDTFEEVATDYILKERQGWTMAEQELFIIHINILATKRFFC